MERFQTLADRFLVVVRTMDERRAVAVAHHVVLWRSRLQMVNRPAFGTRTAEHAAWKENGRNERNDRKPRRNFLVDPLGGGSRLLAFLLGHRRAARCPRAREL